MKSSNLPFSALRNWSLRVFRPEGFLNGTAKKPSGGQETRFRQVSGPPSRTRPSERGGPAGRGWREDGTGVLSFCWTAFSGLLRRLPASFPGPPAPLASRRFPDRVRAAEKPARCGWPFHLSGEERLMPDLRHRDDSGHGYRHPRLLPSRAPWLFWMMLFPLLSGCGGGGGGGGSVGPHETAYVLAENTSGAGSVVAFAFDQTNGTFYSGTSTAATGGTPVQLLFSKGGGHLFVLNSSTGPGSSTGTVVSFAISPATGEISSSPVSTFPTGQSPTSMAVAPGGNYLVIANNGSSSTASIQVVSVSGGTLSSTPYSPSPCKNPYRVVFAPGATGSSSDTFYVACSTLSSSATYSLVSCQILSTSCTPLYNSSGSDGYWTNLTLDPSNTSLVGVGTSGGSSPSGFLVVCTPLSSSPTCSTPSNTGTNVPSPSGNVAFSSSSVTEQVFIGNYQLGQSATTGYAFCTLKTPSCNSSTYSTSSDTSPPGPIFLLGAGSQVYIAATVDTIDSGSSPSSGYLLSCPVSSSGSSSGLEPCSSAKTAVDPVWITLDPSGNYLFVPTLSGELDVFGGVSSGNLSFAASSPASSALSGLQAISVTFQPSN